MEKNSASSKFEAIILNQIYNTNFFNSYVPAINFEYFSCLSSFLSYCSSQKDFQICQQIEDNEIIPKIIAVTSFISDSKNFSCFDKLLLLNDFLKDSLTFKSLTAEKFGASIYSFLDVIVFSGLHNCKLWSKLYRPPSKYQKIESSNKKKSIPNEDEKNDDNSNNSRNNYDSNTNNYKKPLEKLTLWFRIFEETFVDIIKYRFNPTLLDAKHKKQQEKLSKLKKRNPEFINAVKCQDYDKITTLLKEKIDIQVVDEEDGSSAAHIACLKGDLMLCQLLDEYKINWEAEDLENITPVFNAIESANSDLILYLYNNKKVNFEHKDFQNRLVLYLNKYIFI